MYLAFVSLIVAAVAALNSFFFKVDNASAIVSFFGVLVTLLVGLNIIQYMFAENRVREIADNMAVSIRKDFNSVLSGFTKSLYGCIIFNGSDLTVSFYSVMDALEKVSACNDEGLRLTIQSYIVELAYNVISLRSEDSPCLLCPGKRDLYLNLLAPISCQYITEVRDYVARADYATERLDRFLVSGNTFFGITVKDETLSLVLSNPIDNGKG